MNAPHRVQDVFTPNQPARVNFVDRPELENILTDALRTPGRQIVVYGHPGSGKSTLLRHKLFQLYPDHITTRCHGSLAFDQAVLNAFDQLEHFYTAERTEGGEDSRRRGVEASFANIKAQIETAAARHQQMTLQRVVPPQLTPQRLAQFLGNRGMCWVLEDFHKLAREEKLHLAQALKVFVDEAADYPAVRVVAVGAVDTAREVVDYDREMHNRVCELHVPLMKPDELRHILENGQQLLNVEFSKGMKDEVVRYSAGLGGVCHQLALNACRAAGVEVTGSQPVLIGQGELDQALGRYVQESSDTLKERFDKALRRHKVRRYDNCRLILSALARGPEQGLVHNELLQRIRVVEPEYPPGNLTQYLEWLQDEKRGEIIRSDAASGRYSFADPLDHAYAKVSLLKDEKPETLYLRVLYDSLKKLDSTMQITYTTGLRIGDPAPRAKEGND